MGGWKVWTRGAAIDGVAKLDDLENVEDSWEIHDGASRLGGWPAEAAFSMKKRFAKDTGLADSLPAPGFLVVSGRVRTALDGVDGIEWLPVQILDVKGRLASADYFVVNPTRVAACVDVAASEGRPDPGNPEKIATCARLVLRESAIPADWLVFRAIEMSGLVLVRSEVAARLQESGLTGLQFLDPAQFRG